MRATAPAGALALLLLAGCASPERLPPGTPVQPLVATPHQPFRTGPPLAAAAAPFRPPTVQGERLANGLELVLLPRPQANTGALCYVTRAGGEDVPLDRAGVPWFTAQAVGEGVRLAALEEAAILGGAPLPVQVLVTYDSALLCLGYPRGHRSRAMGLLKGGLRAPDFRPEVVEALQLRTLHRGGGRFSERAVALANAILYGEEHRASRPLWGNRKEIERMSPERVARFFRSHWQPDQSALVVTGEVPLAAVRREVRAFKWPEAGPPVPPPPPAWTLLDPRQRVRAVGLEDRAQHSLVCLVERAPPQGHEDQVPFGVLTEIIGGRATSRLMQILREERGYAYSVNAAYTSHRQAGTFQLCTQVESTMVAATLNNFMLEFGRFLLQGPNQEELAAAQMVYWANTRARLAGSLQAARTVAQWWAVGLDPRDLATFQAAAQATTPAQIQGVAQRWLRPERAPVVVTGGLDILGLAFLRADIVPNTFIELTRGDSPPRRDPGVSPVDRRAEEGETM